MKLKKTSRSTHSLQTNKAQTTNQANAVEAIEPVDQTDRFEVGGNPPQREDDREPEESELLDETLADPVLAKEVSWPIMLGKESFTPSVQASFTGIVTLLDTEKED